MKKNSISTTAKGIKYLETNLTKDSLDLVH